MSSSCFSPGTEDRAAGGGLINRRWLLKNSLLAVPVGMVTTQASSDPLRVPEWSSAPGLIQSQYGQPSPFESHVTRPVLGLFPEGFGDGSGVSFTPLEKLAGTITPNGLFFERHHSGIPEINPDLHEFVIHGLVEKPLVFSVSNLLKYPMVTRTAFIECARNSYFNSLDEPQQRSAGELHGLIGNAEWTGVPLAALLEEVLVNPAGSWLLAEGADAAKYSRSIPISKALEGDVLIALYQNGERLRPEQGYPMRLVVAGWQGSMSIKWLRRIKVMSDATHARDETSKHTLLQKDGLARQFAFELGVKSTITTPSFGGPPVREGLQQVTGVAWSGAGKIAKVEVSADGGRSWADAILHGAILPKAITRFAIAWNWDGNPSILMSRATDEMGAVQPIRTDWYEPYAAGQIYHQNAIQSWGVSEDGEVSNVYV
ncbi:sulfite dehydrogenase [uncultured Tateyamaria sp.]|uniref:sulfite dehydrogenase n=1 Tax=uncultured Tateyamaria sp. TaxID=455651 RepID=UPI0026146F06|nr:sulfite dehydrogenase [uncultured Tateyamaria sp.]